MRMKSIACFAFLSILGCGMLPSTKNMYAAIERNDRAEVERQIKAGANVNAYTRGKITYSPLQYTVRSSSDVEIAKLLVSHGAKINAVNNIGRTALHDAALHGQLEMVTFLIEEGADLNIKDDFGMTPYDFAAQGGEQFRDAQDKLVLDLVRPPEKETQH